LANEMDIADHKNPNEQTIEQEYQTYVVAPLSPKGTNTLKFWEVCDYSLMLLCTLSHYFV